MLVIHLLINAADADCFSPVRFQLLYLWSSPGLTIQEVTRRPTDVARTVDRPLSFHKMAELLTPHVDLIWSRYNVH